MSRQYNNIQDNEHISFSQRFFEPSQKSLCGATASLEKDRRRKTAEGNGWEGRVAALRHLFLSSHSTKKKKNLTRREAGVLANRLTEICEDEKTTSGQLCRKRATGWNQSRQECMRIEMDGGVLQGNASGRCSLTGLER